MRNYFSLILYSVLFLIVFISDRVTKFFVVSKSLYNCDVNSFLTFDLTFNRGVSWGMFDSQSTLVFLTVSSVVVLVTIGFAIFAFMRWKDGYLIIGEVLAIAGSTSNIFDRVLYGGVVDFIVVNFGGYSWPVFNIADFCIVLGVFLVSFAIWRK